MHDGIVMTRPDFDRLHAWLDSPDQAGGIPEDDAAGLSILKEKIATAAIAAPDGIPDHIVTLNTAVMVRDVKTKHEQGYHLVLPENANAMERKISVLSPLGLVLFGCRVGDVVSARGPAGTRHLRVIEILSSPKTSERTSP